MEHSAPGAGSRWFTIANALTGMRLLAAPLLALVILDGLAREALALFALAVATDFLDGAVARRRGEVTPLGGLLDHATDATLVVLGLGALALAGPIPWPLPFMIAAAFLQYAIDSRASLRRPLRASSLGRINGIAYYVLLGIPVVRDGLAMLWPPDAWIAALGWILLASSAASMIDRLTAAPR
jgi:CDP-diacylglycerol--glycerol-3-phosphate 3-phosphatidyltransferase